ncbi:MAG TPA: hypothetical protein VH301_15720, partial [Usitatibacter sp.]|nr:hypothetical protein [Usitatibacter sp.]
MRTFVAAFVAGSWWLQHEAALPAGYARGCAMAALLVVLATRVPARRAALRLALLAGAGVLMGYGLAAWRAEARLSEALPFSLEGVDVTVEGAIEQLPQVLPGAQRFVF